MYAENQYTPLGLLALCSLLKQPGLNLAIQNYFSVETSHLAMTSIDEEAIFMRAIGPIKLLDCRLFGNTQIHRETGHEYFNFLNKAPNNWFVSSLPLHKHKGTKAQKHKPLRPHM